MSIFTLETGDGFQVSNHGALKRFHVHVEGRDVLSMGNRVIIRETVDHDGCRGWKVSYTLIVKDIFCTFQNKVGAL